MMGEKGPFCQCYSISLAVFSILHECAGMTSASVPEISPTLRIMQGARPRGGLIMLHPKAGDQGAYIKRRVLSGCVLVWRYWVQ